MTYQRPARPFTEGGGDATVGFPALADAPWERMAIEFVEFVDAGATVAFDPFELEDLCDADD